MNKFEELITKNFTVDHSLKTLESFDTELEKLIHSDDKEQSKKANRAQVLLYNALVAVRKFKEELQKPQSYEYKKR